MVLDNKTNPLLQHILDLSYNKKSKRNWIKFYNMHVIILQNILDLSYNSK